MQHDIRFHLPRYAAYVLTALDAPPVDTAVHDARLTAHDAAHIIAGVGIAHGPPVGAALNRALGVPGDAAGVCAGGDVLGVVELSQLQGVQLRRDLRLLGVDAGLVGTADDTAVIFPRNPAGVVFAGDGPRAGTVDQLPGGLVDARNSAHAVGSDYSSVKAAPGDGPPVDPGNAPYGAAGPGGSHGPCHGQVDDAGSLLDVPEQPLVGALLGAGQAFDGVSAPVEGPAEGGDALQAGEVQIILQTDRFALGPGVQAAALDKCRPILRRAEENGFALRSGAGEQRGAQQHRTEQNSA